MAGPHGDAGIRPPRAGVLGRRHIHVTARRALDARRGNGSSARSELSDRRHDHDTGRAGRGASAGVGDLHRHFGLQAARAAAPARRAPGSGGAAVVESRARDQESACVDPQLRRAVGQILAGQPGREVSGEPDRAGKRPAVAPALGVPGLLAGARDGMPSDGPARRRGSGDPARAPAPGLRQERQDRARRAGDSDGRRRRSAAPRRLEPRAERRAGGRCEGACRGAYRPCRAERASRGGRDRQSHRAPRDRRRPRYSGRAAASAVRAVRHRARRRHRSRPRDRAARRRGASRARPRGHQSRRRNDVHGVFPRRSQEGGSCLMAAAANPSILVIDDEQGILETLRIRLKYEGFDVTTAQGGKAGLAQLKSSAPDIVLTDLKMPGVTVIEILSAVRAQDPETPVILMTAQASLQTAIQAVNEGAFYYIQKPFSNDDMVAICRRAAEHRRLRAENKQLKQEIRRREQSGKVKPLGKSKLFSDVLRLAEQVAPTESTVLIQGESGTGKEVIARYLHELSTRAEGPFLSLNCGALPESLLESELFGHVKGSFTGAVRDKQGLFAAARGGTFFLDEIGEMSPATQVDWKSTRLNSSHPPISTLFPYTTLFRSLVHRRGARQAGTVRGGARRDVLPRRNRGDVARDAGQAAARAAGAGSDSRRRHGSDSGGRPRRGRDQPESL